MNAELHLAIIGIASTIGLIGLGLFMSFIM